MKDPIKIGVLWGAIGIVFGLVVTMRIVHAKRSVSAQRTSYPFVLARL